MCGRRGRVSRNWGLSGLPFPELSGNHPCSPCCTVLGCGSLGTERPRSKAVAPLTEGKSVRETPPVPTEPISSAAFPSIGFFLLAGEVGSVSVVLGCVVQSPCGCVWLCVLCAADEILNVSKPEVPWGQGQAWLQFSFFLSYLASSEMPASCRGHFLNVGINSAKS